MSDLDITAVRAILERVRSHLRGKPWCVASAWGTPPGQADAPPGVVVHYLASAPEAEELIRRAAAAEAPDVPVYPIPGGRPRPTGAAGSG